MARVFDGFDVRLERRVAVKILRPETQALPGMRQRFEQEARIAARLVHPNIVAVLDYGEDDASSYLVMERLPGVTLRDEIVRGPLSQRRLALVTTETLAALAAAHRCGVLHRDIKPSNILLQESGHAKLADFGIAKSFDVHPGVDGQSDDLTMTGVVLGTPGYLAPERRFGQPATIQSDIYSVGAVMVEAATGRRALSDGATPDALVPPFRQVAERALAVEPAARFASAEDMRRSLGIGTVVPPESTAPYARSVPTVPTVPTASQHTPARTALHLDPPVKGRPSPRTGRTRWPRGLRRALLLVVVALAALGATLVVALYQGSQPTGPAATSGSHHTARAIVRESTTTTTQDPEVSALNSLATSLASGDQPGDAALAVALQTTALQPDGPGREAMAQQTLDLAQVLLDGGGITQDQYQSVVSALEPTGATPPTTPDTTPTPHGGLPGGLLGGHGHGHGPGPGGQD